MIVLIVVFIKIIFCSSFKLNKINNFKNKKNIYIYIQFVKLFMLL